MDFGQLIQGALAAVVRDPFQSARDLFSAIGAFATIYALVTKIRDRRTQITVKVSNGFLTGTPGELSDAMLLLETVNTGVGQWRLLPTCFVMYQEAILFQQERASACG